jgi:TolA-binding protein
MEVIMKVLVLALLTVLLISVSLCWANETALQEAYSLYYKGEKESAIKMMEDYVQDNPNADAFYFLGYVYYEKKEMDRAMEYFSEAFRLKSFYSPMSPEENQ